MASSYNSSINAPVSYLEVYKCWLQDNSRLDGDSPIPINVLLIGLRYSQRLSTYQQQLVEGENTDMGKLWKLFTEIMPAQGEAGFNLVVDILKANSSEELANDLMTKCYGPEIGHTLSIQSPFSKYKLHAQVHLSRLIKENVDFMADYWSDIIPIAETYKAFVEVQVVKDFKATSGIPVNKIQDVFYKDEQTIYKRIVMQGDPGCGKTTFANKIALDWANQDEYLRSKFDFVFLIELKELAMSVDDTIKTFLPEELKRFFKFYAESAESKILLILDGFDELQETSQWYQDVMNLLEGKSAVPSSVPKFQFFNILLTSRRSHIDKIPPKVRGQCLLIKGFNEQSMKQFLIKQDVPLPSVGQQSNLSHLLQTPLFCAIYCSLHFGGGDPIELEDSYDLIKALIENSVTNTRKKKTVTNETEQLDEIGKFAFQMLDAASLNFLKKFCRTLEVIKPSFDLSRVNLDLLIKRRIPSRGVCGFKEEFSLHHQLIAEYLGARYFARSLTEVQLKQADISELIPDFSDRSVLNLPFVRFFLFELLFLYLEKKYEESVFNNFLNIPQLRFIWNMKSNNDIPTLDNVIDFDFKELNHEFRDHGRFIPTLSKYRNLSSLDLHWLPKNQVVQLVNIINNNCFQNLIKLDLGWNENVGSIPRLFTALSKCKHLQVLHLQKCQMTAESTTELARCIDNNGLADLTELQLYGNENVGSIPRLFTALSKCKHLQVLHLFDCNLTVESTTELASFIDNNGLADLTELHLDWNENVGSTPQLFTALSKCKHLQVLHLQKCQMTAESTTELARCIDNNGLADLTELQLYGNENVGSIPRLFTALSKCKHLQVLHLWQCNLTVESTTELASCIDNNGLADLTKLHLGWNRNVGSSTELFHVLHKCRQLQKLDLEHCSMTQELLNVFLSMFNSNTIQQLNVILLWGNRDIKVDDNFFMKLEKCPKISRVDLSSCMESDLSEVGRKAKETLKQRGCRFY